MKSSDFKFPSTRYSGSKLRLLDWIWSTIGDIKFDSALDVFGGTASVSLLFKRKGKKVHYNDLLKFNVLIGKAIIENAGIKVTEKELERVLAFKKNNRNFIQKEYKDIFYLDEENEWLDNICFSFSKVRNKYKQAILYASLFQACLAKRPFNLFHRANLNIRLRNVQRTFGNKTTWETNFEELFRRYVSEYNQAIFDNSKKNKVVGGFNAIDCPNHVDLVYIDPPYFAKESGYGTNYLSFYHFLEGLADYDRWSFKIDRQKSQTKRLRDTKEITAWTRKSEIFNSFEALISRFQDNILVVSYQDEGFPSKAQIFSMLKQYKKKVKVFSLPHQYALSKKKKLQLLFVAK